MGPRQSSPGLAAVQSRGDRAHHRPTHGTAGGFQRFGPQIEAVSCGPKKAGGNLPRAGRASTGSLRLVSTLVTRDRHCQDRDAPDGVADLSGARPGPRPTWSLVSDVWAFGLEGSRLPAVSANAGGGSIQRAAELGGSGVRRRIIRCASSIRARSGGWKSTSYPSTVASRGTPADFSHTDGLGGDRLAGDASRGNSKARLWLPTRA